MLHVDKVDTLVPEKIHISASGLENLKCYKFQLILHYTYGPLFSYCVCRSDGNGNIDLARDKPIRGTYHEADSMGLFMSLQLSEKVPFGHYTRNNRADPFYYTLKLFSDSDQLLDHINLRKLWVHPLVTPIEINHGGLYGFIYKPPGPGPFPCIIDVPGISAFMIRGHSAVFSLDGFVVYTFATFGYPGLPKKLQDVDMEIFSKHLKFIQSLPYCSGKIGLFGCSFGGTIANYLATKHPELSAIVNSNSPEAFLRPNAVMKENGVPMKCEALEGTVGIYFNKVLQQKNNFVEVYSRLTHETSLKWENISKDIPFRIVASLDDWLFCGVTNCNNVRDHLKKTGHTVEVDLVPSGHGMYVPYFPHIPFAYNKYIDIYLGFGGECNLATKSQETVWENHLKFFKKHLGTPPAIPDYERLKIVVLPGEGSKL